MIFITGDTHGNFERVEAFCRRFETSHDDILIILGDAGINFNGVRYDILKKRLLESLPITIFAIHGNHEQRPYTIDSYKEKRTERYVDQSRVDKSTEVWLDGIEDRLEYKKWYCGHYHTEKKIDKLEIMFENFDEFCSGVR